MRNFCHLKYFYKHLEFVTEFNIIHQIYIYKADFLAIEANFFNPFECQSWRDGPISNEENASMAIGIFDKFKQVIISQNFFWLLVKIDIFDDAIHQLSLDNLSLNIYIYSHKKSKNRNG